MFTPGQILFGKIFVISFAVIMVYLYRKDLKIERKYYQHVWQVGLTIVLVIVLFTIIVFTLHK